MGQKINLYFNVTGTDSIYSKLLKTVGLRWGSIAFVASCSKKKKMFLKMIGIDSICSKLLKTSRSFSCTPLI